jgi:hypothetical protein
VVVAVKNNAAFIYKIIPEFKNNLISEVSKIGSRVVFSGPPLWSSGQSTWLQMQKSGFDSRHLPVFLKSSGTGKVSTQPREDN